MWISAVSAIVLALLSGGSAEQEEEKRMALGLEPRRPAQLWLPFDPGFEGLIPVVLYGDGSGIYRLITNNAVHMIDRLLQDIDSKRMFSLAGSIESIDPQTDLFLPDKLPNNVYDDSSSLYEAETDNAEIDPHHLSIVQQALKTTSDQELVDLENDIQKTGDQVLAAWVSAYRQLRKAPFCVEGPGS